MNKPAYLFKFKAECLNKGRRLLKVRGVKEDRNQRLGTFVETSDGGERVRASVPRPLSPNPPLDLPTGKARGRIYAYSDYLALLERGTEPLPR